MKRLSFALAALAMGLGCGTSSPSFTIDFPLNYLMDVETGESVGSCCFLGQQGDALAAAGEKLLFIDREAGYVKAEVDLGVTIGHAASSPDGGYGLALSGPELHVVSNETYIQRPSVALPSGGAFILPKPESGTIAVLCSNGTAVEVSTLDWQITIEGQTGVQGPTAAAVCSDGRYFFAADAQGNVYRVSMVDLSAESMFQAPGTVTDICAGPGQEMFMTVEGVSQVWAVDVNTGLHSGGFDIPAAGVAVCTTGDGNYIYVSVPGYGIVVVNSLDNTIEAQASTYGAPADMAVNDNSTRAVVTSPGMGRLFMLQR